MSAQAPISTALPAPYPPTNDPAVRDAQVKLKQIAGALGMQNIAPGSYTIQAGTVITVNASGQITSITNPY